ncbi:MAG: PseG/SpsG family protein [Dermatophilaceae bacterium]
MAQRVGIRVDAWPELGVGHLIRCLALADELSARGVTAALLGEIRGVPWVAEQVRARGLDVHPAPRDPRLLATLAVDLDLDHVVLDGYHLDPTCGTALRRSGIRVLAIVDGPFGAEQEADVYLDQNLGAGPVAGAHDRATHLLGLDFALFRDEVTARRGGRSTRRGGPPRALAVFGGTDAFGAAPVVVPLLLATGAPVHVLAVTPRPDDADRLAALPTGRGQCVEVRAPDPDLAGLAVTCDLAVTAAGSSVWELLCLGVPAGLVQVASNQEHGYRACTEQGVALGIGRLDELRTHQAARERAVSALDRLLHDLALRERLSTRGPALVDGAGRSRVVDILLIDQPT